MISQETKDKISNSMKGRQLSPNQVQQIKNNQLSQPVIRVEDWQDFQSIAAAAKATGIDKARISAALRSKSHIAGQYHWLPLGAWPEQHSTKKQVTRLEDGKTYDSMTEAARDNNITLSMLSMCLRGKKKTAAGYHWQLK